jgi:hypothetical protein
LVKIAKAELCPTIYKRYTPKLTVKSKDNIKYCARMKLGYKQYDVTENQLSKYFFIKAFTHELGEEVNSKLLQTQCVGVYKNSHVTYEFGKVKGMNTFYCKPKEIWFIEFNEEGKGFDFKFFNSFGSFSRKFGEKGNGYIVDYVNPKYKGTELIGEEQTTSYFFIRKIIVNEPQICPKTCLNFFHKCYCNKIILNIPKKPKGVKRKEICEIFGKVKAEKGTKCEMATFKKNLLLDGKLVNDLKVHIEKSEDKTKPRFEITAGKKEKSKTYYVYWKEQIYK